MQIILFAKAGSLFFKSFAYVPMLIPLSRQISMLNSFSSKRLEDLESERLSLLPRITCKGSKKHSVPHENSKSMSA